MAKILNSQSVAAAMKTARRSTSDSFQNFATRTGIGADNLSSSNTYGFNPISRVRTLLEWMYRGSWLCGVGVDCVADDMTREGVELSGDIDPKDSEKVMAVFRRMQIWQSVNQVAKWSRLYGGGLGVMIIDGQKLDTPLRLETVQKGQFRGIIPLDQWMVTPDLNTVVKDPGPEFGNPGFYTIDASSPNFPIQRTRLHHSRVFRMEGIELPYWQKVSENMWGISVIERLFDRLTAFDSATQGAAQLVYRSYLRTLSIENLRELISSGGDAFEAVVKNINLIRAYQNNEGITLLDTRDKFEAHQYSFAGLSDVIAAMGDQISGALQIPLTRLFGQAPAGLNATGESDMRTYYDNILRQQERWLRRPIDIIIQLCAKNAGVELPDGWSYEFNSLWQLTDMQKSEVNAADVTAIVNAQSTGLLPTAAFLKELRNSGKNTGMWTSITDKMIKDAEMDEEVPTVESLLDPNAPNPFRKHSDLTNGLDPLNLENKSPDPSNPTNKIDPVAAVLAMPSTGDPDAVEKVLAMPSGGAELPEKPAVEEDPAVQAVLAMPSPGDPDALKKVLTMDASRIMDVQDIPIYIETPKGTMRRGGKGKGAWETLMPADYGFIEGVPSAEGAFEQLDCYVGPAHDSDKVWIIDQLDLRSGGFDEHKVMIGFNTRDEVEDIYQRAFSDGKGKDRIGALSEVVMTTFKSWMKTGNFEAPYAVVV